MDWELLTRVGQFIFTVLIGAYTLVSNRQKASSAKAVELDQRLNAQDTRLAVLEQQMAHMPDSKQIAELAGDMKAVKVELAGVARELAPLARSLDRINDYLLNNKVQ